VQCTVIGQLHFCDTIQVCSTIQLFYTFQGSHRGSEIPGSSKLRIPILTSSPELRLYWVNFSSADLDYLTPPEVHKEPGVTGISQSETSSQLQVLNSLNQSTIVMPRRGQTWDEYWEEMMDVYETPAHYNPGRPPNHEGPMQTYT
jgi:hypothetical protein